MYVIHDDRTARDWPLPHADNYLEDDVDRLRGAIGAADAELTEIDDRKADEQSVQERLDLKADEQSVQDRLDSLNLNFGTKVEAVSTISVSHSAVVTLDFGTIANGRSATRHASIDGLDIGPMMLVTVCPLTDFPDGMTFSAWGNSDGDIYVRCANLTGGSVTLTPGEWAISVSKTTGTVRAAAFRDFLLAGPSVEALNERIASQNEAWRELIEIQPWFVQCAQSETASGAIAQSSAALNDIAASQNAMIAVMPSRAIIAAILSSASTFAAALSSEAICRLITGSSSVMGAVVSSNGAMTALTASDTGMTTAANSNVAMAAITGSDAAMKIVAASSSAMNAILKSTAAMNALVSSSTAMSNVLSSSAARKLLFASTSAMNKVRDSATAVSAVEANSTAVNEICASSALSGIMAKVWAIGIADTGTRTDAGATLVQIDGGFNARTFNESFFNSHPLYDFADTRLGSEYFRKIPRSYTWRGNAPSGTYKGKLCFLMSKYPLYGYTASPAFMDKGTLRDAFYFGTYRAFNAGSNKAGSRPSKTEWTNISFNNAETYCSNMGTGYHLQSIYEWHEILLRYAIENKTFDIPYNISSYRGIEQFTVQGSGYYQFMAGIRTNANTELELWDTQGNRTYQATGKTPKINSQWIKSLLSGGGFDKLFIAAEGTATQAESMIPDYNYSAGASYICSVNLYGSSGYGAFFSYLSYSATYTNSSFGFRPAKI